MFRPLPPSLHSSEAPTGCDSRDEGGMNDERDDSDNPTMKQHLTVGVLALQGAFVEHIHLLQHAAAQCTHSPRGSADDRPHVSFHFIQVRTAEQLQKCDALVLPGGESTSIALIADRTGLLEPLRHFVKVQRKPVWGTCAGLILLAESANKSKATGQDLIGGLDVRVHRNYFGRQVESFEAPLHLSFLDAPFPSVFIRAPVVEKVLPSSSKAVAAAAESTLEVVRAPAKQATDAPVEILGRLPGRARAIRDQTTTADHLGDEGDIVAVKQGNVFATAFHPELTGDERIHAWWLREVLRVQAGSGTA